MGKSLASKSLVQRNGRFQFEVQWVRYNAQLLYPQLSCRHEQALKGLLRDCKTKGRPQTSKAAAAPVTNKQSASRLYESKKFH